MALTCLEPGVKLAALASRFSRHTSEPQEFLRRVPLLSGVPTAKISELTELLVTRNYRKNEIIFHRGDPGGSLHIIESGQVKILIQSESGDELLVDILKEGDFFGELALLDGFPRTATALALRDTSTRVLSREQFLKFLRGSADAAVGISVALAERLRESDERLAEIVFFDLSKRLGRRLLRLARTYGRRSPEGIVLDIPLSQRELAAFVGATRQSVNKALSQWERDGIIRRDGRLLILLDPQRLYQVV
ncbi:MAG: Crp/Fnr family transcriptional regulator [Chloroflexi bacterium]|nr:Crp/Fnr family transcriptional regulator [Chloroflexota bacterium]